MSRRYILLEVEESRADELLAALTKRSYLRVSTLDRDERQRLGQCPACKKPFAEEKSYPLSLKLAEGLVNVADKMKITKSVIVYNSKAPLERVSPHEHPRCVELDQASLDFAVYAGLLNHVRDGRHDAYHLTSKAIKYLSGEPVSPSRVVMLEGKIVDKDDTPTDLTKLKIKDRVALDLFITRAKMAAKALPPAVLEFIEKGQVSILI